MASDAPAEDFYATLGLSRDCTPLQIRDAYRALARKYHPDLNQSDPAAGTRAQALNAAYEVLGDPARRRTYDRERERTSRQAAPRRAAKIERNIRQEVRLRIEDFLRGTVVTVQVKDPANRDGAETYPVEIPPLTAPGTRLRIARPAPEPGGFVELRLKALPGYRFKVRGSDLAIDLRISARRAEAGGSEALERPTGGMIRVTIPKRVERGAIVRVSGEGLPRPRGGRGDLLVRIVYRPEVRVVRAR